MLAQVICGRMGGIDETVGVGYAIIVSVAAQATILFDEREIRQIDFVFRDVTFLILRVILPTEPCSWHKLKWSNRSDR